jgi:hypothetical protein
MFSEQTQENIATREPELESEPFGETTTGVLKLEHKMASLKFEQKNPTSQQLNLSLRNATTTTQSSPPPTSTAQKQELEPFDSDDDDIVPVFTLSRYNIKTKNSTTHKSVFWPWFGKKEVFLISLFN